jgi:hypothetical protein
MIRSPAVSRVVPVSLWGYGGRHGVGPGLGERVRLRAVLCIHGSPFALPPSCTYVCRRRAAPASSMADNKRRRGTKDSSIRARQGCRSGAAQPWFGRGTRRSNRCKRSAAIKPGSMGHYCLLSTAAITRVTLRHLSVSLPTSIPIAASHSPATTRLTYPLRILQDPPPMSSP